MDFNKPVYEPTTILIDGNHALCRSLYQPSYRELSNSQGMPTGGIYGFYSILKGLSRKFGANSIVVLFDGGHSVRRTLLYEDYKKRDKEDDVQEDTGMTHGDYFSHQLSWIRKLLDLLGIPNFSLPGVEGDDLIFQITHLVRGKKIIVSEDRDFCTLISETTSLYRPVKGEIVSLENFKEATSCQTPKHFLYQKVLNGDGSDNIPQACKGVGSTTIDTLLQQMTEEELSPEGIISKAASLSGSRFVKLSLVELRVLRRNLDLIDISREEFSVPDLLRISEYLRTPLSVNYDLAEKIMDALEFSAQTRETIYELSRLAQNSPLADLVTDQHIMDKMTGSAHSVIGDSLV